MENIYNVFHVIYREIVIMGPYFLLSVLTGGLMKTYKVDRWLYSFLNKSQIVSILIAVIAGVVSPMCSCGILPVFITLLDMGAPLSASISLLTTSPIMSSGAFILTYGVLGYKMAYIKLFGAVFIGLLTGFIFFVLEKANYFKKDIIRFNRYKDDKSVCQIWRKEVGAIHESPETTDGTSPVALAKGDERRLPVDTQLAENKFLFFCKRARELFVFIGKFVLLAIVFEAIIAVYVPYEWIEAILGKRGGISSVINAVLIGIPLPVNGVSVVNVLKGLVEKGMSNGAAVAFLFAGPVTAAPAITVLAGMIEKKVVWLFLIIGILGSFFLGLIGQLW
ncbi:MAG: permease [bacterium]